MKLEVGAKALPAVTLVTLALFGSGCREGLPTEPGPFTPAPRTTGAVYGAVISSTGGCITGASVEVLNDSGQNRIARQSENACTNFDYGDAIHAFLFEGLPNGSVVRLRASFAGYESRTFTVKVNDCCAQVDSVKVTLATSP